MIKHKKLIIIITAIIFFLTALTFYANRVIFPQLVRKIAIEQAEIFLKRKVEIEAIHFNWVKGFIIDKIKIYQKDSTTEAFFQAEGISFGIIFIPGTKKHTISIPFFNINHPSAHLIHHTSTTWNFSDLITPSPTTKPADEKPLPFAISLGAVNIIDGQLRVDDSTSGQTWTELFNAINLKMSLSLKGITYDFATNIPQRQGYLAAKGAYQPITQDVHAEIELKNIDTTSYLSLINIPGLTLKSGVIKKIDLNIDYSKDKTTAKGNVSINGLDLTLGDQRFKGNIDIADMDTLYANGPIKTKGLLNLTEFSIHTPTLKASGNLKAKINDLDMNKETINFEGSLGVDATQIILADNQTIKGEFNLDNIKIRKDKDGTQLVGTILAKNIDALWINQTLKGNLTLKPLTVRMSDENHIEIQGDIKAEQLIASLDDKTFSGNINAQDLQLNLINKKDVSLSTKLSIDNMAITMGESLTASANINATKLLLKIADDAIKISTELEVQKGILDLGDNKTIAANPRLELNLQFPFKTPQDINYDGSLTVSQVQVKGFPMTELIKNIELDADFKTNTATVNALTVNILDTDLRANGTVNDFKNPLLDITAEANDLNLARLKEIIPDLIQQYGLNIDGKSSVKVKFKGLALKALEGKILAVASLNNVNVSSKMFNQEVKNITGVIEATPDSLKWRDFTATYLGQQYTLTGGLTDFKNPKITTSLDGAQVKLKADIAKDGDIVTLNELAGKYLTIAFGLKGRASMPEGQEPWVDITSNVAFRLEDTLDFLPEEQKKILVPLKPTGAISLIASIKGQPKDWKNWNLDASITSPVVSIMNYKLNELKIVVVEADQKIKTLTLDGTLYEGKTHVVASVDLADDTMPFDLALNIDEVNLKKFKIDSPLKSEEINGKFYLTTIANGTIADIKNLHAKGSLAIREGFLAEFALFKGLLGILNEALRLGQLMITDVEANFTIDDQKITTDNLRLKSPTLVLLGQGWVNFEQYCDLKFAVDMSSGIVPPIAEDVLRSLNVHIYDKISNPKFDKKISVPQVINSIIKTIGIFQ